MMSPSLMMGRWLFVLLWSSAFIIILLGGDFLFFDSVLLVSADSFPSQSQSTIRLINKSSKSWDVYWLHPTQVGQRELLKTISSDLSGSTHVLRTFISHTFEVQPTSCRQQQPCKDLHTFRVMLPLQDLIITPESNLMSVVMKDHSTNTDEYVTNSNITEYCHAWTTSYMTNLQQNQDYQFHYTTRQFKGYYFSCTEILFGANVLVGINDKLEFHSDIRRSIAAQLENHTCANANILQSSPDISKHLWVSADMEPHVVHVKLNQSKSQIHLIENFASAQECQAMEDTAKDQLRHAAVADGKGGVQQSKNRKAMQAGIDPDYYNTTDHVAKLSLRVYEYTNHVMNLNLSHHGQEPLMSIQYFGRGTNDTEPDQYMPHCDSACAGRPFKYGSRVATMVIYCTTPEIGGATNFQNSNIYIRPTVGSAIFFSYLDTQTMKVDDGLSQHSGCPVYQGEKKIVTQWVRYGVNETVPWGSFNTLGILRSEAMD